MKNNSPVYINSLNTNEIFVFGSNLSGIHGAGAAKQALKFGAVMGVGIGLQGQTYAIPTKDYNIKRTLTIKEIIPYVDQFIDFAYKNIKFNFLVTEIGCGLAGYSVEDIAPLFKNAIELDNIHLPLRFNNLL